MIPGLDRQVGVLVDPGTELFVERFEELYVLLTILDHQLLSLLVTGQNVLPELEPGVCQLGVSEEPIAHVAELVAQEPAVRLDDLVEVDLLERRWRQEPLQDQLTLDPRDVESLAVVGDYYFGFIEEVMKCLEHWNPAVSPLTVAQHLLLAVPLRREAQDPCWFDDLLDGDGNLEGAPDMRGGWAALNIEVQNASGHGFFSRGRLGIRYGGTTHAVTN